jgi:O-antigen/teichoic acid export membrane protein
MDGLRRGTVINLVTRVLGVLLGLGIVLITARMGTQEQGAYALFIAVESTLLMLGSGFGVALARRVSHHREHPAGLAAAVVSSSLGIGLVCALGLAVVSTFGPEDRRFLGVLAWAAPVMFVTSALSGLWLGGARMMALARISLATPILTLAGAAIAFAALGRLELVSMLWSWVAARVIVALVTLATAWRQNWIARPDWPALRAEMPFVATIGLTNLIGLLNYKADLFLVEHFLGRSSTGVYSVAVMIAELLWLVSSSVTQAAYARIGTSDGSDASRVTVRVVHASLLALVALAPAVWVMAALLLPLLLGPDYAAVLPVLAWLLPGVLAYGAASPLSAYFTNHAGRPRVPAALATFSLVVNIVLSLYLIPRHGMIGGALATTVSYLASILVALIVFGRLSGMPPSRIWRPDWHALRADVRRKRRPLARS